MLDIGLKDIIDILLVALMLYYTYRLMKDTRSLNVFFGVLVFLVIWLFVSRILEMRLLGAIMDKLISVGVLALIIIFQQEIREFLYNLGTREQMGFIHKFFGKNKNVSNKDDIVVNVISPIVMACESMSKEKVGALIVIQRNNDVYKLVNNPGDRIDAEINQRLIENIFFKNSPLHDGAMIVTGKRIQSAAAVLPISHNRDIPKSLGLRHRAALGMSEKCDAVVIVVSEETGGITVAMGGEFKLRLTSEQLMQLLTDELTEQDPKDKRKTDKQ